MTNDLVGNFHELLLPPKNSELVKRLEEKK